MALISLFVSLIAGIAPALAQTSASITSSTPSATLIGDTRVTQANGALTAALIGVSNCESTFVIQCFGNPICSLHGPATVTQGPSAYETQWVYNTPGGTASHSESCAFPSLPGIAQCYGYTTITGSSNQASTISSAFTVAVQAYQVPLTQGAEELATPWSVCTPTPTAAPTSQKEVVDHRGLSTGAQAGIGAGIGLFCVLLLCLLLFLWRRRKADHSAQADQREKLESSSGSDAPVGIGGKYCSEMQEHFSHYELPQHTMPQQLYGSETPGVRHELPASRVL